MLKVLLVFLEKEADSRLCGRVKMKMLNYNNKKQLYLEQK